jgi:hypothetical protein
MKTNYDKQAEDFLIKTGTEIKIEFLKHDKHFEDDKETRDIYKITLLRGSRSYTFNFGQSLKKSGFKLMTGAKREIKTPVGDNERTFLLKKRSALIMQIERTVKFTIQNCDKIILPEAPITYDILSCLTKYDPGTLENFCDEFGYDVDNEKVDKIYHAVKKEYLNVCALFNPSEVEELAETQ